MIFSHPGRSSSLALMLLAIVLSGCASPPLTSPSISWQPAPTVTRAEALAIAEAYRTLEWTPDASNAFHGMDPDGIRVHTPDRSLPKSAAARPGWWNVQETNVGMPYMWGGFDTPHSFTEKLQRGFYAGDVYTPEKRRLLYDGVSRFTCGIDCSGFISRCWKLDRPYSTRELPNLCHPLSNFDDLLPGDIVNKTNVHALLFVGFLDQDRTHFLAYETGSAPSWKVLRHTISVDYVQGLGYRPYRYRNIIP